MRISNPGIVPSSSPAAPASTRPVGDTRSEATDSRGHSARRDSVEISDAGRALEAQARQPLTPERVREIRARILTGGYDTVEIMGKVAASILDRGDA
jgi:anti-sigma28 factor (negative regulator of flagellin synthesis)